MVLLHSSPRSGSTLLRVLLAGHSALCAPPELNLLWDDTTEDWARILANTSAPGLNGALQGLVLVLKELFCLDKIEAENFLQELILLKLPIYEVYARLQEQVAPRILIDKSPSYSMSRSVLQRGEDTFERPKIIFLIRHPYAMIDSFVRLGLHNYFGVSLYGSAKVSPYEVAEEVWRRCNQNITDYLTGVEPERQMVVRFEDLVTDPREVMENLCDFLEVPFEEAVLQPYDGKQSRMITGNGDPNILQHSTIKPELGEIWKNITFPHQSGPELQRLAQHYNYSLDNN